MLYDRNTRISEREKNKGILQDSIKTRDEIVERKTDKIRKRYERIEAEIRDLQEEKQKFFEEAMTKEEVLKVAKEALRAGREDVINRMLVEPLKTAQDRNTPPFTGAGMRVHICSPEKAWRLFFFAVSEKDLEQAVALLPDVGMPASEREAEIEKINKKIAKLQKSLKEDLDVAKLEA